MDAEHSENIVKKISAGGRGRLSECVQRHERGELVESQNHFGIRCASAIGRARLSRQKFLALLCTVSILPGHF